MFLEFSTDDYKDLQSYAADCGVLFSASAMDVVSLQFLNELEVPFIKIGSGDFLNIPLLKMAIELNKPLIVSTGMTNMDSVINIYNTLKSVHLNFCLLHCVSAYPTPMEHIHLNVLKTYRQHFPDVNIGYSGHELGIDVSVVAVALGAKVIERHFTLDKNWKGSDHVCSLNPSEFRQMVKNIRALETNPRGYALPDVHTALGSYEKKFQPSEMACYEKLGKTIVASKDLVKGEKICNENICIKVAEPKGIRAEQFNFIQGKTVTRDVKQDQSIFVSDLI